MTLVAILAALIVGGLAGWLLEKRLPRGSRWTSLLSLLIASFVWASIVVERIADGTNEFSNELDLAWIPTFGVRFHVGADSLSLALIGLTLVLGVLAVAGAWREIQSSVGFFHFNLLWTLAGVVGVFIALDLVLFYFFWELMLVPMYLLIGIWGHERRIYAATKFFIFTQASGLLMLVAIVGLALVGRTELGLLTFDYTALRGIAVPQSLAWPLMLGFLIAFAVKLPLVPFHTWLPDAHGEAPTAGSVILAGLLLKTGGYGLLRFVWPLFPRVAEEIAPLAMALGAIGILYGALLAFSQDDLKRLVAYTSVSHLGFVMVGVFSNTTVGRAGAVFEMLCHGLSTGGLFLLAGALQERLATRDLRRMGGLWPLAPRMGAAGMLLALASLGLPGLGNFVAELLVLIGAYRAQPLVAVAAAAGLVLAAVYALALVQRVFFGPSDDGLKIADLGGREKAMMALLAVLLLWLGLYPQPALDFVEASGAVAPEATALVGGF